jgi:hypothetical protein
MSLDGVSKGSWYCFPFYSGYSAKSDAPRHMLCYGKGVLSCSHLRDGGESTLKLYKGKWVFGETVTLCLRSTLLYQISQDPSIGQSLNSTDNPLKDYHVGLPSGLYSRRQKAKLLYQFNLTRSVQCRKAHRCSFPWLASKLFMIHLGHWQDMVSLPNFKSFHGDEDDLHKSNWNIVQLCILL